MLRNKKLMLTMAVLIIPGWLAAFTVMFLFALERHENIKLKSTSRLLEQSLVSLNSKVQEVVAARQERESLEQKALNYMEWQFMLKDQADGAEKRLAEQIKRAKNIKHNKELLNVLYSNLGLSQMLSSDFNNALRSFEKAVSFDQRDAASYYNLGLLYSVFRNEPRKAVEYYSKYLSITPSGSKASLVQERIASLKKSYEK